MVSAPSGVRLWVERPRSGEPRLDNWLLTIDSDDQLYLGARHGSAGNPHEQVYRWPDDWYYVVEFGLVSEERSVRCRRGRGGDGRHASLVCFCLV